MGVTSQHISIKSMLYPTFMCYTCSTFLFTFFLCPEKVVAFVSWFSFLCILHSMLSTVAQELSLESRDILIFSSYISRHEPRTNYNDQHEIHSDGWLRPICLDSHFEGTIPALTIVPVFLFTLNIRLNEEPDFSRHADLVTLGVTC